MPIWDYLERQAAENRPTPQPYTVREGDNWPDIAQRNNINIDALLGYNPQVGNVLVPGTVINVPTPSQTQGYSLEDIRNLMQQGPGMGFGQPVRPTVPNMGISPGARNRNVDNPLLTMSPIERARQQNKWAGRLVPSMLIQTANPNLNRSSMSMVRSAPQQRQNYGVVPENVGAPTVQLPGTTVQQRQNYGVVPENVGAPTVQLPGTTVQQSTINRGGGLGRGGGGNWGGGWGRGGGGNWGGSWGGGWGQSSKNWQGVGLVNWRI